MKYAKGDIVLNATGYTAGVYVITELHPERPKNCYDGLNVINRKKYRLSDESLGLKIGTATAEFLGGDQEEEDNSAAVNLKYERGKIRADNEVLRLFGQTAPEKARWKLLAAAKPGDRLTILLRGRRRQVTFRYVLERGEKYVFLADDGGTPYRFPLGMLVLPTTALAS